MYKEIKEWRPYQKECLETIAAKGKGRWLVKLATGMGKTAIFTHVPHERMLILSHRQELVDQPLNYFPDSVVKGKEIGSEHAPPDATVVSASVQSIARRLQKFSPESFDLIVVDEAHHSAAPTYRKILDYFKPEVLLGFTATPNRADGARLDDVYQEIIYDKDLRWGIEQGYLCDIECKRAYIGYDLSKVSTRNGDYALDELGEAMSGCEAAIAEAYRTLAKGSTLIFAVNVEMCEDIAALIDGAVVVSGKTPRPEREDIIRRFDAGEIPCIVNCMVLTEGTDITRVETIIMARPTQSDSLYIQMVGRGLRLFDGKERLRLIDCCGVTGKRELCQAPTLLGEDFKAVPEKDREQLEGLLFELPEKIARLSKIEKVVDVDLWSKFKKHTTHGVSYQIGANGSVSVSTGAGNEIILPPEDELGNTYFRGSYMKMQDALDIIYATLSAEYADQAHVWSAPTPKQLQFLRWKGVPIPQNLTKKEAQRLIAKALH